MITEDHITTIEKQANLDLLIDELRILNLEDPRYTTVMEEIESLAKEIMGMPNGATVISIHSAA
jgi:uncharacterized protein YdcH (DUF465 family)